MTLSLRTDTIAGPNNILLTVYISGPKNLKFNFIKSIIICFLILSSDLTMATTSGKSKANCSTANVALLSASTRQQPWHRCRRIAHQRTGSSPARHLTPALPTVLPVLLKTVLTLSFDTCTRLTDTQGCLSSSSLKFCLYL